MIFANWNKNAEGRLVAIWNNPAKVEQRSEITSGELSAESLIVEGDDQPGANLALVWSNPRRTETYAFGEVDRSIASGVSIKGGNWSRAQDTLGISYLAHFLSKDRREYLEKGGISYFIGDGWLNYRPEQIFETYYNLNITKNLWLTADLQRVWNPAYNADRGPLNIYGARIHAEF